MLATLIIVFREIIEAGIVVGIVMAATKGVPRRAAFVAYGIVAGILGACIVALFANQISAAMQGAGEEMFNVAILSIAVCMLTWHNVWMARHGREIAVEMKAVGEQVVKGQRSLTALAVVVGIAVLREGSEIVLFLYGIALAGNDSAFSMMIGGALGVALGAAVSALMYFGLLRLPTRHLFRVTSWLIALLAAGMASQVVSFLQQAGALTALDHEVWNSSWLISEGSIAYKVLHTMVGYTAHPTAMQLIVYVATLTVMFTLMRLFGHAPKPSSPSTLATAQ